MSRSRLTRNLAAQGGMTIVEVTVAAAILLVGVLGTLALIGTAQTATQATRAREGATSLARELVERTRNLSYTSLTAASVTTQLQAMPGFQDQNVGQAGWVIRRRDVSYTVAISICTYDDAKDGLGDHSGGGYCENATGGTADVNPDDYRRLTVDVSWDAGGATRSIRQRTVLNNTGSAVGPRIVTLTGPSGVTLTNGQVTAGTSAGFALTLSSPAAAVPWMVDGASKGSATWTPPNWTFSWDLTDVVDGAYIVSAQAEAESGTIGNGRSVTVTLNRFAPNQVNGFAAGRNGGIVDLEWKANSERDIIGYRVTRTSPAPSATPCGPLTQQTTCMDTSPPSGNLVYTITALDRTAAGAERTGPATTQTVNSNNTPPNPPTNLQASTSQGTTILAWTAPTVPDPDAGGSIDFYRIYRDGQLYGDRYDRTSLGTETTWTDTRTDGIQHDYSITAVDDQLAESTILGPVTR